MLNIITMPAYIEGNPDLLGQRIRSFKQYKLKYEHSLDYSILNNDKFVKATIGTVYQAGKSDLLILII